MQKKVNKYLIEIIKKTSVEYPSRIAVTEFYIEDHKQDNTVIFIDDIMFLVEGKRTQESGKARRKAVSLFLKEIKNNAKTVKQCERIYERIVKEIAKELNKKKGK